MEVEVIDGVEWRRERYSNGQLCYEHPYVNGELHGLCRGWYSNEQLWYKAPCVKGQRHGLRRCWHKNGQLFYEYSFVNGELHGLCRIWKGNEQLSYIQLWKNSKPIFEIENPPKTLGKWKLK